MAFVINPSFTHNINQLWLSSKKPILILTTTQHLQKMKTDDEQRAKDLDIKRPSSKFWNLLRWKAEKLEQTRWRREVTTDLERPKVYKDMWNLNLNLKGIQALTRLIFNDTPLCQFYHFRSATGLRASQVWIKLDQFFFTLSQITQTNTHSPIIIWKVFLRLREKLWNFPKSCSLFFIPM